MDVRPGAEPYRHDADGPAVLLCHGFTGSPASLRPWAEHHALAGAAVSVPLLPGHGTHWRDMQRTRWPDWYDALRTELLELTDARGPAVIGALSMGASLALRLAAERPDLVRGLVLVNPSVKQDGILPSFAPLLQYVVPSVKGILQRRPGRRRRRGRLLARAAARLELPAAAVARGAGQPRQGASAAAGVPQPRGPRRRRLQHRLSCSRESPPRTSRSACSSTASTWPPSTTTRRRSSPGRGSSSRS